jgi:fructose-1,6-bisphosphatase/inositol monophosphatase family enzyme
VPSTEAAVVGVGEGAVCTNFPYDVAAAALVVEEAGAVITHADGRSLADHPAIGCSRAHGLAVLGAANHELHGKLLGAIGRGIERLRRREAAPGAAVST